MTQGNQPAQWLVSWKKVLYAFQGVGSIPNAYVLSYLFQVLFLLANWPAIHG